MNATESHVIACDGVELYAAAGDKEVSGAYRMRSRRIILQRLPGHGVKPGLDAISRIE